MERARELGGDTPLFLALGLRAKLAAYAGREADARSAAEEALEISRRTGSFRLAERIVAALGFLELSLGRKRGRDRDAAAAAEQVRSGVDTDRTSQRGVLGGRHRGPDRRGPKRRG